MYIYSIDLENGKQYIGVTIQPELRWSRHQWEANSGHGQYPLYRAMRKHSAVFRVLAEGSRTEILDLEVLLISSMDNLYNVAPGGANIKPFKYTDEAIIEDAQKYSHRTEWRNNSKIANTVRKYRPGLYERACSHMTKKNPKPFWSRIKCLESARKYTTLSEWRKQESGAHTIASKKGWLRECTSHMTHKRYSPTDDEILASVKEFYSYKSWRLAYKNWYQVAHRRGLLKDIKQHFK